MTDQPFGTPSGASSPVGRARLDANWQAIEIELDAPRPSRIEALLRRIGVPAWATRLVVATPALRRAWYLAIAGAVFIALSTADQDAPRQSLLAFLAIAPLVGVLGVAMAYGPGADPAHELHLATPMSGLRVLAVRTMVVLAVSSAVITTFTLMNPTTRGFAAAWYLPAIAVTAASLALMTFLAPRRAATAAGVGWCAVVLVSQLSSDPLVAFTLVGQIGAAVVAVTAIAVTVKRRGAFDSLAVAT